MKRLLAFAITALLAATGCKQGVSATVNCKVTESMTVECAIAQTQGTAEVEVCWDFKVTCASGATLETAHSCGTVKDGQSTNVTITADKITVTGTCDQVTNAVVTNMTIGGKKAQE